MKSITIRDAIIRNLKNEKEFKDMVAVPLDGIMSAAADVAFFDDGAQKMQVFKIAVVPYKPDKKML